MEIEAQDQPKIPEDYQKLLADYLALQKKYLESKSQSDLLWSLMTGIGQRLQISAASVKAAVSSLLHDGFFWDVENRNEFLSTIDNSIDRVTQMLILFVLLTRSQGEKLGLKREGHHLQEILLTMRENLSNRYPQLNITMSIPEEGLPVFVDFAYLSMGIQFLLEASGADQRGTHYFIDAEENNSSWLLEIDGLGEEAVHLVDGLSCCDSFDNYQKSSLSSENAVQIYVALQILRSQEIAMDADFSAQGKAKIRLHIPVYHTNIRELPVSLEEGLS